MGSISYARADHTTTYSCTNLVVRGKLLYTQDGRIHVLYVVQISKHERLFHIKATSYDVLGILIRQSGIESRKALDQI